MKLSSVVMPVALVLWAPPCCKVTAQQSHRPHFSADESHRDGLPRSGDTQNESEATVRPAKKKPTSLIQAMYESTIVGGLSAAASTGVFIGIPILAWFQHVPSNETTTVVQYWKIKAGSIATGVLAGGIIGGLILVGGTAIAMGKLLKGILDTPRIIWEAGWKGRKYWNATSAQWECYSLIEHAKELRTWREYSSLQLPVNDDSFYRLLNVPPSATSKEIKRSYFRMAKKYHPDKNHDPKSQAKFLELHTAYKTLYNPESRKIYDQYGLTGDSGGSIVEQVFDFNVDVFFEVLLGFSPKVEQYVGDLSITFFSKWLVETMHTFVAASKASQREQQVLFQRYTSRFFFDAEGRSVSQMNTDQRQVDIALYLQSFIRPFLNVSEGEIHLAESAFVDRSKKEAKSLGDSTPFASFFLDSIGYSLYWECGQGNNWNSLGALGRSRRTFKNAMHWSRFLNRAIISFRQFHRQYEVEKERLGVVDLDDSRINQSLLQEAQQRAFRSVLTFPSIMESFIWPVIDMDISKTLKGSCWKLINDRDSDTTSHGVLSRRQHLQYKALQTLGAEFMEYGGPMNKNRRSNDPDESKSDDSTSHTTKMEEEKYVQNRLQVALYMA